MRKRRFTAVHRVLALFAVLVPLSSGQSKAGQWLPVAPTQGFEEAIFPAGKWIAYDGSYNSTQGRWGKHSGGYNSASAVHPRAGVTPYNYNTWTWMRYGPFSLAGATTARMLFWYKLDTEVGYDFFGWEYSCSGVAKWTGRTASGNVGVWGRENFSLQACAGQTQVYVQFTFKSDQSVNYQGVWVDNVVIQKYVP